ncbi:MAG: EexN family lipoprotein [Woeseiaceae bacterium]|nr:EexN family lipoprotein [Woeseiaceae bacterium]
MRPPPIAKFPSLLAVLVAAGCAEEIPPRSVQQFLDDPIQLEAAVVRCAENRSESRYDPECMNARQAVSIIEAREERARREAWEAQSERKREALRRTQEAAAEARRRAAEAERLREEAEYLAQFGESPPAPDAGSDATPGDENAPGAVIPPPEVDTAPGPVIGDALPASDGGNAPSAGSATGDLDAVREELRRRSGDESQ